MTDKQYEQLEKLLGKLGAELNHTFCIIPNYIQDGCNIGIYGNDGNIKAQSTAATIKEAVTELTKPKDERQA
jgi:hypothetical protein